MRNKFKNQKGFTRRSLGSRPMGDATTEGFTLIETVIYIALFAFIMTGALVSIYGILGSSARNQTKAMVQEEGSFLLGKIDWALSGVETINLPDDSDGDGIELDLTLSVKKFDTSPENPIVITLSGGDFTISRGGGAAQTLNNTDVTVSCDPLGCFTYRAETGDGINPESLEAKFNVSALTSEGLPFSQDFSTIKYLRK